MGTISITYPDEYRADIMEGLRRYLDEDAEGLTDDQVAKKAVRRFLRIQTRPVVRVRVAGAAVIAAQTALSAKEEEAVRAVKARQDAEIAAETAVYTAFGSDS